MNRYLTHAVVLGIAVAMSSYAAMDRHFPTTLTARLGPVNAEAVVVGEGGDVGDVSMGRYSTIIKPAAIPPAAPQSHQAFPYTVAAVENLSVGASKEPGAVAELPRGHTQPTSTH